MLLNEYQNFVRERTVQLFPNASDSEIGALIRNGYERYRINAYPATGDQFDLLFHDPEAWRASVEAVKTAFPKPLPGDDTLIARFRGHWTHKVTILNAPPASTAGGQ